MRKQAKMSDHCPKCGSKQSDVRKCGSETLVYYECGSSRLWGGRYVMSSDKCENAYLKAQLKSTEKSRDNALDVILQKVLQRDELRERLAENKEELALVKTLLTDILPLAMGESCFYDGHPEADQAVHCCDWSPIVDRICETLGREKPKTGLGAWYKQLHHPNAVNELKRRNMERCVVIGAVSRAYQDGLTDWEQITAIVKEAMAKLHQHKHWLELGGQS